MNEFPLSQDARLELERIGVRHSYPKNKVIMKSGASLGGQGIYFILSGSVLIYVLYNSSHDQCVLDYLHQGDFVGELPLFTNTRYRSATVKTNEKCELLLVDNLQMRRLLARNSEILMYMTGQLAERLHQTTQRLYTMSFLAVEERLMHFLLLAARKLRPDLNTEPTRKTGQIGEPIELRITRREIGHTIGCARETAGKLLKKLERHGYLRVDGMIIVLLEPVKMIVENFENDIARIWLD
ncbi:MAG: cyclic nucleotide-binding domain-containing protein [Gammaproteobacteria bacterium]|nr:cyclic nucleotide-binding domain-containing protein [Pseudomonadota bacterium]MCH9663768.1 cyclic nucleotide-binding domain-containing protein [Gammaproteobacteria bacterium]